MNDQRQGEPQPALGRWIAAVLRVGTLGAVALTAFGYLWARITARPGPGTSPVIDEIAAGGPDAITALGLLAMTLIPIAVVAAAVLAFHRSGERGMTATSVLVGLLLIVSLVVAAVIGPSI